MYPISRGNRIYESPVYGDSAAKRVFADHGFVLVKIYANNCAVVQYAEKDWLEIAF